jgi:5-methylcytosine-specific restriction endonuclease McrA
MTPDCRGYCGLEGLEELNTLLRPEEIFFAKAYAKHVRKTNKLNSRQTFKARLFRDFGGLCPYCLTRMRFHTHKDEKVFGNIATADHVIPRSKGGANTQENLLLVCARCNLDKGNMGLIEFMMTRTIRDKVARNRSL